MTLEYFRSVVEHYIIKLELLPVRKHTQLAKLTWIELVKVPTANLVAWREGNIKSKYVGYYIKVDISWDPSYNMNIIIQSLLKLE